MTSQDLDLEEGRRRFKLARDKTGGPILWLQTELFCNGGSIGFSLEELERIKNACETTIEARGGLENEAKAQAELDVIRHHMPGWTSAYFERKKATKLWLPTVALFVASRGYLSHVFVEPGLVGIRTMCGVEPKEDLEWLEANHTTLRQPIHFFGQGRGVCESCRGLVRRKPAMLRWLPPQRETG